MIGTRRAAFLAAASVWLIGAAASASAADIKLGGLIFGQYAQHLGKNDSAGTQSRGRGEFSISRIYLTAEGKYNDNLKGKIVVEGKTNNQSSAGAAGAAANNVFLKNAYGEYTFHPSAVMTFGLIGTPWIGFEEGIWGRRFVQKVLTDQAGTLSSADKGVGLSGKIPAGYGDYHATYVNGEGTTTDEVAGGRDGRYKDAMARVSVIPLPNPVSGLGDLSGLKIHAYAQQGRTLDGEAKRRDRYIAGASYQNGMFHLMYTYLWAVNGDAALNRKLNAYSVHGSFKLPKDFSVFGRYDRYYEAKAAATGDDAYARGIFGVDYKVVDGVRLSVNDQVLKPLAPGRKSNENQLMVQGEMKF